MCKLLFMQRDRRQVKKPVDTRALSADPHSVAAMTRPVATPEQALHPELPGCLPTAQEGAEHTFRQLAGTNLKISLEPPISYPG